MTVPWAPLKQLSDRTPLRTKLITAMLALVIMALVAIGITSVVVLRHPVCRCRPWCWTSRTTGLA